MDNLCSRGVIFYDFRFIVGSPRWLAIFKFNQTLYATSLSMGECYCGVRKFRVAIHIRLVSRHGRKPVFWVQNGVHISKLPHWFCQIPIHLIKNFAKWTSVPLFLENLTIKRFTVRFISISQPQLGQKIDFKKPCQHLVLALLFLSNRKYMYFVPFL